MKTTTDRYTRIINHIINAIESGAAAGNCRMPWHTTSKANFSPINAASRKTYRGINTLSLWVTAQDKDYDSGLWGTYKQWQQLGAQVRKGETSSLIVFWKVSQQREEGDTHEMTDNDKPGKKRFAQFSHSVFNAAQVEGYDPDESEPQPQLSEQERMTGAEHFFAGLEIEVRHGGNQASYQPDSDFISLPEFAQFESATDYCVRAHESTHATAHLSRCDRDLSGRFGSDAYGAEELIAELGAAFLCADLGLSTEPREDHAQYIESWLKVLRQDKRAIFIAARKAQQAVDWMHEQVTG